MAGATAAITGLGRARAFVRRHLPGVLKNPALTEGLRALQTAIHLCL